VVLEKAIAHQRTPDSNQSTKERLETMTKLLRAGAILGTALLAAQLGFADNHKSDASIVPLRTGWTAQRV